MESQYASLLSFSATLSPHEARAAADDLNLSRSSPFGPLSQTSSRRAFAYIIATLNASHPDYDFSHLRPSDFRREKSLRSVMYKLDTTLYNLRPKPSNLMLSVAPYWSSHVPSTVAVASSGTEAWNPRMWRLIDKEMSLKDCSIYSYSPDEDPYDGEEGAIWSFNYLFFNKVRKRVCYIYLRGLSIISHISGQKTPLRTKREADADWYLNEPFSPKRARYWLGDGIGDEFYTGLDEDDEDVIESRENEGVRNKYLADDIGELRQVTVADEVRNSSINRSTNEAPLVENSDITSPSLGNPSIRLNRSTSAVQGMGEHKAELVNI